MKYEWLTVEYNYIIDRIRTYKFIAIKTFMVTPFNGKETLGLSLKTYPLP